MKPLRCLILDDEAPARQELRQLLSGEERQGRVEIVAEAASVAEALERTAAHRPDAVFVDIKLRGESGFDYMNRLATPLPRLVFVTAYDQYAIRAFECNAVDYLLKPIPPERLAEALRRLRERLPVPAEEPLFLKTGNRIRLHSWEEIHHIVSEGNYTRVFLKDGASVLKLRALKEWLRLAPEGLLLRVHRKALVCGEAIREITTTGNHGHTLQLSDGTRLPIGRVFWPALQAAIGLE